MQEIFSLLKKVAVKLDLDKLAIYEYNPSPVGTLLKPNKKGKIKNTITIE